MKPVSITLLPKLDLPIVPLSVLSSRLRLLCGGKATMVSIIRSRLRSLPPMSLTQM